MDEPTPQQAIDALCELLDTAVWHDVEAETDAGAERVLAAWGALGWDWVVDGQAR